MKERYEWKVSEFEDKLKNMEEKDKSFKELRIKNELESRKKSQMSLRTIAIMKRLGKRIWESVKEESMVGNWI